MVDRICTCGKSFQVRDTRGGRKYCDACRRIDTRRRHVGKQQISATCRQCQAHFLTSRQSGFCSQRCRDVYRNNRRKRAPCMVCNQATGYAHTDPRGRNAVHLHCRPPQIPRNTCVTDWTCQNCGKECSRQPTKGQAPKYCGKSCEQLAAFHRRRARLVNAFVEDVNRLEVFMSDGYKCYLCGKKTDPKRSYPHPKSPTIDHVIPLNRGGLHERANCRTACARCNAAKQDRGGGEQFALVL